MNRYCLVLLISISIFLKGMAQPFESTEIAKIQSVDDINLQWADINSDGKLDIVGFWKVDDITEVFTLIQLDSTSFKSQRMPFDSLADLNFQIKDMDHNGILDVIFLVKHDKRRLLIALNMGAINFQFEEIEIPAEEFIVHDLDNDGDEDFILSCRDANGREFITLLENDSIFIERNRIENYSLINSEFHISNEKVNTIIHNSKLGLNNELVEFVFENDSIKFGRIADFPLMELYKKGDFNHDGKVDYVISTLNEGLRHQLLYYQKEDGFMQDTLRAIIEEKIEYSIGDIDLDGFADIIATTQKGIHSQTILFKNNGNGVFAIDSSVFQLVSSFKNLLVDINDDGDLDLLSLVQENDSIKFYVQLNQTTISNTGPDLVYIYPPLTIYDQTFFSWDYTSDDHTDSAAISYELFIHYEAAEVYHTIPGYDLDTSKRQGFRKLVGNGFQWFDRKYTANRLKNGRYHWGVVGVDNAYYASSDIRKNKGGTCTDFYTPVNCFDLLVEDTTVCFNSEILIDVGNGIDSINWFSVKHGFLEKSTTLNFKVLESDTIYAVYSPKVPCYEETDICVLNYSMAIEVNKRDEQLLEQFNFCEGSENVISIEGNWSEVNWWFEGEIVSKTHEISLDSIPKSPIIVEAFDSIVCPVYDTLELELLNKMLNIELLPTTLSACTGQASQIDVFSSIDIEGIDFLWIPPELFNDPNSANPIITAFEDVKSVELIVTENNCYTDTIKFSMELFDLPHITTNGDQEIYLGERVLLEAFGSNAYNWQPLFKLNSPNSSSTWVEPLSTTQYTVIGTDLNGCYEEARLIVFVKKSVFIPDLFSPNGDGNNDLLMVYGEQIQEMSFRVFNEKGALLFESNESSNIRGWDGTYLGGELPSGTYFWTVRGQFKDGQSISYQGKNKGSVRLVR